MVDKQDNQQKAPEKVGVLSKGDSFIASKSGKRIRVLATTDATKICNTTPAVSLAEQEFPPAFGASDFTGEDTDWIIKSEIDMGAAPGTKVRDVPDQGGSRYERLVYWVPRIKRWVLIPLGSTAPYTTGETEDGATEDACMLCNVIGTSNSEGTTEELTVEVVYFG